MKQRKEFVLKAIHTSNFRQLCQEYGISPRTGYKWLERFYEQGFEGMGERSRRPQGHAKELGEAAICEMIRLKHAHPKWGPRKLRPIYQRLDSRCPMRVVSSGSWSARGWGISGGSGARARLGSSVRAGKPVLPTRFEQWIFKVGDMEPTVSAVSP